MGPVEAVKSVVIKNYVNFSGRAPRSEYWWFILAYYVFMLVVGVPLMWLAGYFSMTSALASGDPAAMQNAQMNWFWLAVLGLITLALFLPSLGVLVRRLHDRNISGWWVLGFIVVGTIVNLIPFIGPLIYLGMLIWAIVILARAGDAGSNRFGPNPLGGDASSDVFA